MSRTLCGWCATNFHDSCKPKIVFYDKTWYCSCEKCKDKQENDDNEKSNSQDVLPEPTTDLPARSGSDDEEPKPKRNRGKK